MSKKKQKKARPTEIFVVLDRSGSMAEVKEDAIGGFNTFLAEQRKLPGSCHLSLLQFDTEHDLVHDGVPLSDVPDLDEFTYRPRAMTALLDAIARGVAALDSRLEQAAKKTLPVFAILTDGLENSSHEATREQVFSLIEKRKADGWLFQYLGAGQDAIAEAGSLGIDRDFAATYAGDSVTTRGALHAMSTNVAAYRSTGSVKSAGFSAQMRADLNPGGAESQPPDYSTWGGSGSYSVPPADLVRPKDVADALGVSTRTLSRMRSEGRGPTPVRPSGSPRGRVAYRRQDLDEWLKNAE